jgi:hypothetical protein
MCTVTIVACPGGRGTYRVAANRDESDSRRAALPPERRVFGRRQAVMPVDPESRGTWIGVNDAGLTMTVLNGYQGPVSGPGADPAEPVPPPPARSRGTIVPSLLDAGDVSEALRRARALQPGEYASFRLVMVGRGEIGDLASNGETLIERHEAWDGEPRLFTSSGLGDQLVDPPRRSLFEALLLRPGADLLAVQEAYHRHSWPDAPHLSVCMRRPGASTVSFTRVEVDGSRAIVSYHSGPPDLPAERFEQVLPLGDPWAP